MKYETEEANFCLIRQILPQLISRDFSFESLGNGLNSQIVFYLFTKYKNVHQACRDLQERQQAATSAQATKKSHRSKKGSFAFFSDANGMRVSDKHVTDDAMVKFYSSNSRCL